MGRQSRAIQPALATRSLHCVKQGDGSDDPHAQIRKWIEAGNEMTGQAGGATVGFVLGGPIGAGVGAALGTVVAKTGVEVMDRLQTYWQHLRAQGLLAAMNGEARRLIDAGATVRDDDFFEPRDHDRSEAEEVLEASMLAAASAYEQMKIRHLGAILPSAAVRTDLSLAEIHWVTRTVERLSWRQLVTLAVAADNPTAGADPKANFEDTPNVRPGTGYADEVDELAAVGLLGLVQPDGGIVHGHGLLRSQPSIWGVSPQAWCATPQGATVVEVARLDEIGRAAREEILRLWDGTGRAPSPPKRPRQR